MNTNVKMQKHGGVAEKVPLNTAVGDRDLCAWQPVKGVVWIQTRESGLCEAPGQARRRPIGRAWCGWWLLDDVRVRETSVVGHGADGSLHCQRRDP